MTKKSNYIKNDVDTLSLNVMTFNVRISPAGGDDRQKEWNERKDFVLSILKGEEYIDGSKKIGALDFIGIQEAGGAQIDYIVSNMDNSNYKQVPGNGPLLLYKADNWSIKKEYSFDVTGDQWGPRYVKCGLFNNIMEQAKNVFVCNTHLNVGRDERESYKLIDENLHKIRQDGPDFPIILMGDFNANCSSGQKANDSSKSTEIQGMGCKVNNGLVDIFAPKPEENNFDPNDNRATFHNWSGGHEDNYHRIDHIFIPDYAFFSDPEKNKAIVIHVSRQLAKDEHVLQYPSDHFPVISRLYMPLKNLVEHCNDSTVLISKNFDTEKMALSFTWSIDSDKENCERLSFDVYNYLGVAENNKITTLKPDDTSFKETIKDKSQDNHYKYYLQTTFLNNQKSQPIEIDIKPEDVAHEKTSEYFDDYKATAESHDEL